MKDEDWPDWLRARQDLFPRDYLASYVALTTAPDKEAMPPGDVFELQLLLLSPGWLSSYEFSVSRSQKWGVTGSYSINMVPVSAVSHVEAKDSPVKWEEEASTGEYEAKIRLSRELPPFSDEVELNGQQARDFIAALVKLGAG